MTYGKLRVSLSSFRGDCALDWTWKSEYLLTMWSGSPRGLARSRNWSEAAVEAARGEQRSDEFHRHVRYCQHFLCAVGQEETAPSSCGLTRAAGNKLLIYRIHTQVAWRKIHTSIKLDSTENTALTYGTVQKVQQKKETRHWKNNFWWYDEL